MRRLLSARKKGRGSLGQMVRRRRPRADSVGDVAVHRCPHTRPIRDASHCAASSSKPGSPCHGRRVSNHNGRSECGPPRAEPEDASYLTGTTMDIDGGSHMH